MVDEESPSPVPGRPRVVKKVVKKTVVRPAAPAASRPSATTTAPRATAVSRVSGGSTTKAPPRQRPARPSIDLGGKVGALGSRGASALRSSGSALRRTGGSLRDATGDRVHAVRTWRIPHLSATPAALVTGLVVGLTVTTLGWLSMLLFSATRGTSSGGGLWGGLAVLAIAGVALGLGSWLLAAFGAPQPRLTEVLALITVVVVVMLAFLETASGAWAWLVVPGLSLLGHLAAVHVVALLDGEDRETA